MRMANTKSFAAAALSVVLALVLLAGCGTNAGNNGGETGNAAKTGDGSAGASTGKKPVELSMFIDFPWYPVKEWKGPIADMITEKTGVKLNITVSTDDNQLPVMIASGNLPDLIFTANQVDRLSNSNLSYPWDDLINKYAPDFKIDPTRKLVNSAPDGKFYTVRNAFATQEEWNANPFALGNDGNPGVAVRTDILKALGNPQIKTVDDFVNVLEKVKAKYPDMVPLIMDPNWMEQYFKAQFGVDVGGTELYEGDDNKLHMFITHPKMLEYYKFMNSLYRKGLIIGENFAFSNDQIDDDYANSGKAFAHMHTVSIADTDNLAAKKSGKPYTWQMLPTALSPDAVLVNDGIGFAGTFITKSNKHPEESIKFLQYLASDEGKKLVMWGVEGKQWHMDPKGYPVFNYNPNDGDYVNSQGLKWYYFYSDAIAEGLRAYVPGTQTTEALLETKKITKIRPVLGLIHAPADSEEQTIKTKIDDLVKNQRAKIILAKTEQEAVQAYQDMINTAQQYGMGKYEQWATEQYAQKKDLMK
ncbi:extracellular solute-binding protein [Paenibacillus humicola]|uniref:extracellular solute-binding protein n=1 Tax=Paenibacillus humicola TaxID=3110540 RepID=UPI00237C2DB1|nr:extracellular solute-binding protein [Paenibacillus humicola]